MSHHFIGTEGRSSETSTSFEFVFEQKNGSKLQLLSNINKVNGLEFIDGSNRSFIDASAGKMRFYNGSYWMQAVGGSHTVFSVISANSTSVFKEGDNTHIFNGGDVQLFAVDESTSGNVNNPRNLNFRTAYKTTGGVANSNNIRLTSTTDNTGLYQMEVNNDAGTNIFIMKSSGVLNYPNPPTSATGLVTGDIWNNSGVLTIV